MQTTHVIPKLRPLPTLHIKLKRTFLWNEGLCAIFRLAFMLHPRKISLFACIVRFVVAPCDRGTFAYQFMYLAWWREAF